MQCPTFFEHGPKGQYVNEGPRSYRRIYCQMGSFALSMGLRGGLISVGWPYIFGSGLRSQPKVHSPFPYC